MHVVQLRRKTRPFLFYHIIFPHNWQLFKQYVLIIIVPSAHMKFKFEETWQYCIATVMDQIIWD